MKLFSRTLLIFFALSFGFISYAQDWPDTNPLRSNTSESLNGNGNWVLGFGIGNSFGLHNDKSALFLGNNIAAKMFGRHYFGKVGLGLTTGIAPGRISQSGINKFITENDLTQEKPGITTSNPLYSYVLFGPSVRFGHRLSVNLEVQGGLFLSDAGSVHITQPGAGRSLYGFDNADQTLHPGFSAGISVNYPVNRSTQFFINGDYLQTRASILLEGKLSGYDAPTKVQRSVKSMVAGIGIIKTFSTKKGISNRLADKTAGQAAQPSRSKKNVATGTVYGTVYWGDTINENMVTGEKASELPNPGPYHSSVITVGLAYAVAADSGKTKNPIFSGGGMSGDNPLFEANKLKGNNPLYEDKGSSGDNPLFGQRTAQDGGNVICGATPHLRVILINVTDGKSIAETQTDSCGNFRFSNVAAGNYAVKISGGGINQKMDIAHQGGHMNAPGQDFNTTRSNRERGQFLANPGNTDTTVNPGTPAYAPGQDFNTTRSNRERGQFLTNPENTDTTVNPGTPAYAPGQDFNTTRSNRDNRLVSISVDADTDGDGIYETDVTGSIKDEINLDKEGKAIPGDAARVSRGVSKRSSLTQIANDLYLSYGVITINGKEVPVRSLLKTKHDTVKNSINNVR